MKDIIGKLEVVINEPDNELVIERCHVKFGPKIITKQSENLRKPFLWICIYLFKYAIKYGII